MPFCINSTSSWGMLSTQDGRAKTKLGIVVLHVVWGLFTHMECAWDKS